jgi:hypothetical protein
LSFSSRFETKPAKMSAQENKPTTKKFGKGERSVPHASQKASKWYPAHVDPAAKKVRGLEAQSERPKALASTPRAT